MQSLRDDWRDYKRDAALLDCDDLLYTARNFLLIVEVQLMKHFFNIRAIHCASALEPPYCKVKN